MDENKIVLHRKIIVDIFGSDSNIKAESATCAEINMYKVVEKTNLIINKVNSDINKKLCLWNKLKKELKPLNDNNYTVRIIYDYINKNFEPK